MTQPAPPTGPPQPMLDAVFGDLWSDRGLAGRPRLAAASLAVGALAAVILPYRDAGIGTFLVLASVAGVVAAAGRHRLAPSAALSGLLALALLSTLFLRDADWLVALSVLAAAGVGAVTLVDGRSVVGVIASLVAMPLAGLRSLPWVRRSVAVHGRPATWWPAVRTGLLSAVLLLLFGSLFASADALFAAWVGVVVPDLTVDDLVLRLSVLAAVGGMTVSGAFVALAPPNVEKLARPRGRAVGRYEWAVPVGAVAATFVVFLAAQSAALFGGHAHLRRTTGLTYADYVHQGFGQLTVVTILTLAVVAAAAHWAPRESPGDRTLLRAMLGLLCLLTLVVVASALYRMHVYEQAYGFTRLRLLVSFFEAWLGIVVAMVMAAGLRLRGAWVPRAAFLAGAAALLALALLNPDRFIATQNLERLAEGEKIDLTYLSGLSADAAPALADVPGLTVTCPTGDDWLEWNLGRSRAASLEPCE